MARGITRSSLLCSFYLLMNSCSRLNRAAFARGFVEVFKEAWAGPGRNRGSSCQGRGRNRTRCRPSVRVVWPCRRRRPRRSDRHCSGAHSSSSEVRPCWGLAALGMEQCRHGKLALAFRQLKVGVQAVPEHDGFHQLGVGGAIAPRQPPPLQPYLSHASE
jgi:hypothetical protein